MTNDPEIEGKEYFFTRPGEMYMGRMWRIRLMKLNAEMEKYQPRRQKEEFRMSGAKGTEEENT